VIKLSELIWSTPGLPEQQFHDHWRHPHATLAKTIRSIRQYTQFHRLDSGQVSVDSGGCVGVAEVWFDNATAATALAQDSVYLDHLLPDELFFVDRDRLIILMCEEEVVRGFPDDVGKSYADGLWSDNDRPLCIKLLQFVTREDADRWETPDESELGMRLGAFRHIRSHVVDPSSSIVGIRELFWPTLTSFERAVAAAPEAFEALRALQSTPFMLLAQGERVM
jgi:uncharacterized protein (TIGR02118 family)